MLYNILPLVDRTAEDVEDVRREVQIMHHLEGHPNIVKIFGAFEDKHSVHLVNAFPHHPWQLSLVGSDSSLSGFFSQVLDRAVAVERTSTVRRFSPFPWKYGEYECQH